jgi:Cof subfamily protein (haloacid dehalogenase superfamily)
LETDRSLAEGRDMIRARNIRLLISDVDGTLVTNDKVLTPGAIAAAKALREAGIGLAITSSRPPHGMRMLVEPLDMILPMAGCNGGVLVNPDLSVIETHAIEPSAAKRTVDFLGKQGLDVWLYTETEWFVPKRAGPHVDREAFILQSEPVIASAFTDAQLADAVKIVGVSDDHDLIAASETAAQLQLGKSVSATRSAAHFLDVTNPLANKGQVLATLARRLGVSPDQIATIGDMPNDVMMFRKSGFSIAMGNASAEVKAQASAVTESNQEDGFAKAVRTLILPSAAS